MKFPILLLQLFEVLVKGFGEVRGLLEETTVGQNWILFRFSFVVNWFWGFVGTAILFLLFTFGSSTIADMGLMLFVVFLLSFLFAILEVEMDELDVTVVLLQWELFSFGICWKLFLLLFMPVVEVEVVAVAMLALLLHVEIAVGFVVSGIPWIVFRFSFCSCWRLSLLWEFVWRSGWFSLDITNVFLLSKWYSDLIFFLSKVVGLYEGLDTILANERFRLNNGWQGFFLLLTKIF